jgi:hypothetical protein
MAEIEIGPLGDHLSDEEIAELAGALENFGVPRLPRSDDAAGATIAEGVDGDLITEFLDRLEAHDVACEIYLPVEFEGRVEVADLRVGSAATLLDVLEEMKEDLDIEDGGDGEDGEEDYGGDVEMILKQLRHVWKLFYAAARTSLERRLPLHLHI